MIDHASLMAQLKAAQRTTRGTDRRRAPKGYWRRARHDMLAGLPPGVIERLLRHKLRLMSAANRAAVEGQLQALTTESRRVFVLKLLSR